MFAIGCTFGLIPEFDGNGEALPLLSYVTCGVTRTPPLASDGQVQSLKT
jgi:hypothetical protein